MKRAPFAPEDPYHGALANPPRALRFSGRVPFRVWQNQARQKLRELLGHPPSATDLNVRIDWEKEHEGFLEKRFIFTSEPGVDVPCRLLLPRHGSAPFPLIISLKGTPAACISRSTAHARLRKGWAITIRSFSPLESRRRSGRPALFTNPRAPQTAAA